MKRLVILLVIAGAIIWLGQIAIAYEANVYAAGRFPLGAATYAGPITVKSWQVEYEGNYLKVTAEVVNHANVAYTNLKPKITVVNGRSTLKGEQTAIGVATIEPNGTATLTGMVKLRWPNDDWKLTIAVEGEIAQ